MDREIAADIINRMFGDEYEHDIYSHFEDMFWTILDYVPDSDEKYLAFSKLQQCMNCVTAAIEKNNDNG